MLVNSHFLHLVLTVHNDIYTDPQESLFDFFDAPLSEEYVK